jgi:hypothetical protein
MAIATGVRGSRRAGSIEKRSSAGASHSQSGQTRLLLRAHQDRDQDFLAQRRLPHGKKARKHTIKLYKRSNFKRYVERLAASRREHLRITKLKLDVDVTVQRLFHQAILLRTAKRAVGAIVGLAEVAGDLNAILPPHHQ